MREYRLTIDEALKVGLSPELMVPTNSQFLYECYGFRVGKQGLEPYVVLTNPLPAAFSIEYNWPFPQFMVGDTYNILVVRDMTNIWDVVYTVSDDHATVIQIAVVDQLTYGILGTLMEFADFGEYAIMMNGVAMVQWDPLGPNWVTTTELIDLPLMRTICNFKGQAVGGGVTSTWYDCDETFYAWSKIGSIDFIPDRNNTAGFRRCPYGGLVRHTRRLGDLVVGYSSKGITFLTPVTDPAVTFKFIEIEDVGIINQGAMDGNLKVQLYVGSDYIIRMITSKGVEELGYQHLMEQLTADDIIVSFEPSEKNFYISDGAKTFMLSPKGMTEVPQHPSAVWGQGGENYILPAAEDVYSPTIATEVFDMGYAGQKTISVIETDAVLNTDPEAAADYGTNMTTFASTEFIPINEQGSATVIASGSFFRFKLRFAELFDNFRIGWMVARYKMTDLRSIRGVYAPPPRGQ